MCLLKRRVNAQADIDRQIFIVFDDIVDLIGHFCWDLDVGPLRPEHTPFEYGTPAQQGEPQ